MPNVGKIQIGSRPEDVVILFDKGEPPLHVDLVTELAEEEGIIRVSFAAHTGRRRPPKSGYRCPPAYEERDRMGALPGTQGFGQTKRQG